MTKAKNKDVVAVDYTGTFEDGTVFDTSEGKHPLEFKLGEGNLIKGFEEAIVGMGVNEEKTITLKPEQAYGPRNDKLQQELPLSALGNLKEKPKPGTILALKDNQERVVHAFVKAVDDEKMTLDLNHPLAGKTLIFKLKLISINK